jgi:squalene-hopene/tetraprenyl-beta-curcumene cyclase
MTNQRTSVVSDSPIEIYVALDAAIEGAVDALLRMQAPEGYWVGELEANVTLTAEYLFLRRLLGCPDPGREAQIARYLLSTQIEDGGWAVYYGGPGDLNCTVEAYFALKLAGYSADHPALTRARELILQKGGLKKARVFTRIWLACFGQVDWRDVPGMPTWMILLPSGFVFSIYHFASWARSTIVPLLPLLDARPVMPVPPEQGLAELDIPLDEPPDLGPLLSWRRFFLQTDRQLKAFDWLLTKPFRRWALRGVGKWLIEHQEESGDWGGIFPAMSNSVLALYLLGRPLDDPHVAGGLEALERFGITEDDTWRLQSCISPVWDTGLALLALQEAELPAQHPALQRTVEWLMTKQSTQVGDWAKATRPVEPGGWWFEHYNEQFPDCDDTAVVLLALHRAEQGGLAVDQREVRRGLNWLRAMQCDDGGWAGFDRNNTSPLLKQIPFCDFGEVIDPPSADVTAHTLEYLGAIGTPHSDPALRNGLAYLLREQEPDGAWFGRWGINYIYGTGAALPALAALGFGPDYPAMRRGADWLERHQNQDGGWGEDPRSYKDPAWHGRGESTPSQTAWALLGLIAAGRAEGEAARRGVVWLVEHQQPDGTWDEPQFTGTGFPGDFYINYHLYRDIFPLLALARYRQAVREG